MQKPGPTAQELSKKQMQLALKARNRSVSSRAYSACVFPKAALPGPLAQAITLRAFGAMATHPSIIRQ